MARFSLALCRAAAQAAGAELFVTGGTIDQEAKYNRRLLRARSDSCTIAGLSYLHIRMLSSPSDSEVLSAARALCRMGIHDVAERVENGPKFETAIRYARPRQTREIARLSRLVEELQSQVARFAFRSCLVCGKPFRAGRADASTCSARCRTRLCRHRRKGGPQT